MMKKLLHVVALSIGLCGCSYKELPISFVTDVTSGESFDSSLLSHLEQAKGRVKELTGNEYNGAISDIDLDGVNDVYLVLGDYSLVYVMLSSNLRSGVDNLDHRVWSMIDIATIEDAKQRELEMKKGNPLYSRHRTWGI